MLEKWQPDCSMLYLAWLFQENRLQHVNNKHTLCKSGAALSALAWKAELQLLQLAAVSS